MMPVKTDNSYLAEKLELRRHMLDHLHERNAAAPRVLARAVSGTST